jgi:TonB-dependent starch-binding outer membrane protein SusC
MALGRYLIPALTGALLWSGSLAAQGTSGTITGRVLDSASSTPIPGVAVRVEGTQLGALSRDDGVYFIGGVPTGSYTVRATRIGYAPRGQSVTVTGGGTATANFTLPRQAAVLQEVVTVGYGTQRREAITGSVATVDPAQANVGVIANANQMLQGRVAGVHMTTNNGEPGAGTQIRIRGGTSISASNDPLYVVDGVPLQNENAVAGAAINGVNAALGRSPINTINPNDIESITVLKDAAATAIYGSRGANGVILIQTKRGGRGVSQVEYDTYVAAAAPARRLNFLTGNQYRSFVQQQVSEGNLDQAQLDALGSANTDWEDELMQTGIATNHNLSFSGGSTTTQYRASLNYFDQQGVVKSNGLTRYQGRLNGQHQALSGKLNLGLNLTASRVMNDFLANENGGGFSGGVFTNMAIYNPTQPVRVTDASTGETRFFEVGLGAQGIRNPVALVEQIEDEAPENRILGNLTGSISLLPSLTAQTTLGVDYSSSVRRTYIPRSNPIGAEFNGVARQAERSLQTLNFQQLLTFTPQISDRQEFEVVGGYEYSKFDNGGFEAIMQGFITDAFSWNNLGAGTQAGSPVPISYRQESQLASFFGRANYGFLGRYFLTGVVRYDGSSRLAEGNQWSVFPALSASWRISEEEFMSDQPFGLSQLALRAGWGKQGNQAVRPYATQLLLRADNGARYPFGSTVTTGLVAAQVANPNLKWETSTQLNLGLDYGFANDRFTGLLDLYQKETDDLLLDVTVPQPAVVNTRLENIGKIRNRGLEATLDARLIERATRTVNAGLIFALERNEVVEIGGDREFIITGNVNGQGQSGRFSQRIIPGQPLGTFWGPQFVRVDAATGKQYFRCARTAADCVNGETTGPVGDDEAIIGDANPDFSLGFRTNATWNKFDASWLWRGEFGRDVFNNTALVYSTKGNSKQGRNFLESAIDDGIGINEPAIFSSLWIEDGSFVRLQNVTVGYTFDLPSRLGSFGRATRVYLSGDNLLLFTGYDGYDPEVHTALGLASRGIDYLTYPRARTFTLGARVQF